MEGNNSNDSVNLAVNLGEGADASPLTGKVPDIKDALTDIAETNCNIIGLTCAAAVDYIEQLEAKLSTQTELEAGDGVYYITQEAAMAPGISGAWPKVIPHPTNRNGRLVKRQWIKE